MAEERIYNLEKRTLVFGQNIVTLCKGFRNEPLTRPMLIQIIRSGTSIGANYVEANGASSKKDFAHKIFICKKEAQETKYWLSIIASTFEEQDNLVKNLQKECQELVLIFNKIASSSRLE
ncbi:MAG: four helix bundle protein [Candidatus Nomurabacteria bacterium]